MYSGEVNAKKLDNWIHQLEVYSIIHNLQEDDIKIQLASLRMEGSALLYGGKKGLKKRLKTMVKSQCIGQILFLPLKGNSIL